MRVARAPCQISATARKDAARSKVRRKVAGKLGGLSPIFINLRARKNVERIIELENATSSNAYAGTARTGNARTRRT